MLFSFMAVMAPTAPVHAVPPPNPTVTSVTALTPHGDTTSSPAYIKPGGSVTVNFAIQSADNATYACTAYMVQGSSVYASGTTSFADNGSIRTLTVPSFTNAPTGYYSVYVNAGTTPGAQLANAVYIDSATPSGSISSPNLCWPYSTLQNITYTVNIPGVANEKLSIVTVTFNGSTIRTDYNVTQGSTTFTYNPGTTPVAGAQLVIVAQSQAGNTSVSSYYPPTGTIKVMGATLTGVVGSLIGPYLGNQSTTILFNESAGDTNFTFLMALNKGDGNSENITAGWLTPATNPVQYSWTVPNDVTTTNASVALWIKDCAGNITGPFVSNTFAITSISHPSVIISSPVAGTVWYAGTTDNITWTVTDPMSSATHTCIVEFSINDNTTGFWQPATITAQGNTGASYWATLSIPATTSSTNCEIRVTAQSVSGGQNGIAYSSTFTVTQITTPPTVTVVSPLSTSIWQAGTTQTLGWTVSGTPSTVKMDYKIYLLSGGSIVSTITTLINQSQCPSTACTYIWSIPSDTAPGAYNIRVMACYLVGPGPQEQMCVQYDSQQFTITATSSPCVYTTQHVPLHAYWNLISLQAQPASSDISTVLADVLPNVISIWYLPGGSNTWQNYIPAAGAGTLTSINDGKAYWVQMTGSFAGSEFTYQGRPCPCGGSTPLQAYVYPVGWNMVGFKSTIPQPVNTFLPGNCGTQYASPIQGFNGANQAYVSLNCSENMTPGMGYWVYFGVPTGVSAGCK